MQELKFNRKRDRVRKVKSLIESAGNSFGSVWFYKRSDGKLRKLAYRLHVTTPTYEKKPDGKMYRKTNDTEHNLITVFDTNTIRYNNKSRMCGRGGYKSIPLDTVCRIKVGGVIYRIKD